MEDQLIFKAQPPPPPTFSARYMLSIPFSTEKSQSSSIFSISDSLGFDFEPLLQSKRACRSIGAKLSSVQPTSINIRNNVQVGDVLYMLNNKLVKTDTFDSIIEKLVDKYHNCSQGSVSFVFERGTAIKNSSYEKSTSSPENEHLHPAEFGTASETSQDSVCRINISVDDAYHLRKKNELNTRTEKIASSRISKKIAPTKQSTRDQSYDLSTEEQILHSIFSPTGATNSRFHKGGISNLDFTRISDVSKDSAYDGLSKTSSKEKEDSSFISSDHECIISRISYDSSGLPAFTERSKINKLQENNRSGANDFNINMNKVRMPLRTIYQNESFHDTSQLASPTFTYSPVSSYSAVTDRTESTYSPLGLNIHTSTESGSKSESKIPRKKYATDHKTPSRREKRMSRNDRSRSYISPESEMQTPEGHTHNTNLSKGPSDKPAVSTFLLHEEEEEEQFLTPSERLHCTPSIDTCSVSTVFMSPQSQLCNISWKNIPMSMLDFNFVQNCNSEEQLEFIKNALSEESPPKYPSLLRIAKSRLCTIRDEACERDAVCKKEESKCVSSQVKMNMSQNKKYQLEYTHDQTVSMQQQRQKHGHHATKDVMENKDDIKVHNAYTGEMEEVLSERNEMQMNLSSQVNILLEKLHDLEEKMSGQVVESSAKIAALEKAKNKAEEETMVLKETVVSSSKEARIIKSQFDAQVSELDLVREELRKLKEDHRVEIEIAEKVKLDLRARIANLSKQIQLQEKQKITIRALVEKEMRSKFEEMTREDKVEISNLRQQLKDAHNELEKLSRERSLFSQEINDMKKQLHHPRQEQLIIAMEECAIAESAANAMAKALAESEYELSMAMESNRMSEQQIKQHKSEKERMEATNKELSDRIKLFNEELKSSHVYIDNLYAELTAQKSRNEHFENIRKDWEASKNRYERVIEKLKSQIDFSGEMVSPGEYEQALREASVSANDLKKKQTEVEMLLQKIDELETLLAQKTPKQSMSLPFPQEKNQVKTMDYQERLPKKDEEFKGVSSPAPSVYPKTASSTIHTNFSPPPTLSIKKTSSRISAVRAAGGRAALKERLKKSRGTIMQLDKKDNENKLSKCDKRAPFQALQGNKNRTFARNISSDGKENMP